MIHNSLKMILASLAVMSLSPLSYAADHSPKPIEVELKNAQGEKVGTAKLSQVDGGVSVLLVGSKLPPGKHGIHFHENGKCDGPDFKSAGGHLNPAKKEHGLDNPKGAHAGDLSNLEVMSNGTVETTILSHGVTLRSGETSLLKSGGTSLVIHAKADDQHTSPSGNSGDRIACGVIH
jgi:Cu-Zn family superoxide dismutase